MITYYEELGVAPYATKEQIERAYRWLVQKFHPDKNADFKEEAKAQFVRFQQAFDTLSDPVKRVQYDQELRRARQPNSNATATEKHETEPVTKKRKQRSFVLSPIWLTMIICFGVLAVAIFVLHNQSNVNASSDSHSARSLNDQRVSAVPKDLDKIVKAAQELSDDSTAIETTLNRYDRFEFTDYPLGEVVKLLQNNYPLQILFDTTALKEAGIDPAQALITCNLKHARVKTFLNLVLCHS